MKMLKEIGLIGLGVMGKNIALNLSDNGVSIKAFNDSKEKLEEIKKEFSDTFEGQTEINNQKILDENTKILCSLAWKFC